MIKNIEYCFHNKKILSIYCNKEDTTVHLTGYIYKYDLGEVVIAHITPRGEYDGFVWMGIDDIYRIDYDSAYENKIEALYKIKKQLHPQLVFDTDILLHSLLSFSKKKDYLVTLELGNNQITGFVNHICDEFVRINVINEYGGNEGVSVVSYDEIVILSCDTDYEQDISIIRKYENNIS